MKKIIPRYIIIKMCKTNDKKILIVAREKNLHYVKRTKDKNDSRLFVRNDLSQKTVEQNL